MNHKAKIAETSDTDPRTDESLDELDESVDDAFDELQALDQRTKGQWVKCVCTKAGEVDGEHSNYDIEYRFETFHGEETVERFEVPTTVEGSHIKNFLDRLGYSVQNAKVLERDSFWLHAETREVRSEVPSKSREWVDDVADRFYSFILSDPFEKVIGLCTSVGAVIIGPIGGIILILIDRKLDEEKQDPEAAWGIAIVWTLIWMFIVEVAVGFGTLFSYIPFL